jgi:hypothetical protein
MRSAGRLLPRISWETSLHAQHTHKSTQFTHEAQYGCALFTQPMQLCKRPHLECVSVLAAVLAINMFLQLGTVRGAQERLPADVTLQRRHGTDDSAQTKGRACRENRNWNALHMPHHKRLCFGIDLQLAGCTAKRDEELIGMATHRKIECLTAWYAAGLHAAGQHSHRFRALTAALGGLGSLLLSLLPRHCCLLCIAAALCR